MASLERIRQSMEGSSVQDMGEAFATQVDIVKDLLGQRKVFDHEDTLPNINIAVGHKHQSKEDTYFVGRKGALMELNIDSSGVWKLYRNGERIDRKFSGQFNEMVELYGVNVDKEVMEGILNIREDTEYSEDNFREVMMIVRENEGRLEVELVMAVEDAREKLRSLQK